MVIAIDFDGTLVENKYPDIGEPLQGFTFNKTLIEEMALLRKQGHKVILWTCRNAKALEDAVNFCKERNLEFDAVNDDLEENKVGWEDSLKWWKESGKARKIYADIYIDDRALSTEFQKTLGKLLNEVCV